MSAAVNGCRNDQSACKTTRGGRPEPDLAQDGVASVINGLVQLVRLGRVLMF